MHEQWLDHRGLKESKLRQRRLSDLATLLLSLACETNSARPVLAVDGLAAMDHRLARQALVSVVMSESGSAGMAAARALADHPDGLALLDRLWRTGAPGAATAELLLNDARTPTQPAADLDVEVLDATPSLRLA